MADVAVDKPGDFGLDGGVGEGVEVAAGVFQGEEIWIRELAQEEEM